MQLSSEKKTVDMRGAYGDALVELGKTDARIVCVGGDTTDSLKTKKFGDKYPERMFNVGIAEANLVSIAAGLAIVGKVAFASTYAAFVPGRAVDQIRNAICYPKLSVKLVVSHGGLTVGPDGATHQQIEDIGTTRSMPNMNVLMPADGVAVRHLVKEMVDTPGPFYMRLARPATELVYADSTPADQFKIGRGNVLVEGSDATIIACGLMVAKALEASAALKRAAGLSVRVVDMFTIKPIDTGLVARCAKETGALVTAEEHNILGGLGAAVAEAAGETYPVPIRRVGVRDVFGESCRDEEVDTLLEQHGMTATEIARSVAEARSRARR
jgi:transketolase